MQKKILNALIEGFLAISFAPFTMIIAILIGARLNIKDDVKEQYLEMGIFQPFTWQEIKDGRQLDQGNWVSAARIAWNTIHGMRRLYV